MITVVVPTQNSGETLAQTLTALVPGVVEGVVREVIIVDGGSTDRTLAIAESSGAEVVTGILGRGAQLKAGAERARFPWLLFLRADTVLDPGWEHEAATFIERIESGRRPSSAAAFTFALDDEGTAPRLAEKMAQLRCAVLRLPYGDQGLLIPRTLYNEIGGYRALPVMEDVDLVRRLMRRQITMLRTRAANNLERSGSGGHLARMARNQIGLALFAVGVPPERIVRFCGGDVPRPANDGSVPARKR